MIHELKCDPEYFAAIENNQKTFEVRKNDRPFRVGDYLALNELDDTRTTYTGKCRLVKITYILDNDEYCKEGYVIISFRKQETMDKHFYNQLLSNMKEVYQE